MLPISSTPLPFHRNFTTLFSPVAPLVNERATVSPVLWVGSRPLKPNVSGTPLGMNWPRWKNNARVDGFSALVFALMMTADSWAHSLKFPSSGSGFQPCSLRGSGGNVETAWAIAGVVRLTAQGSAGGGSVLVVVAELVVTAAVDSEMVELGGVLVGVGVFATVESPDPQPAIKRPSDTLDAAPIVLSFDTARRTTGNGTVSGCADPAGAARLGIRLPPR